MNIESLYETDIN